MEAIPGYLSLHQTADLMTLKWTPNQLMNGNVGELDSEKRWKPTDPSGVWAISCFYSVDSMAPFLSSFLQRVLGLRYDDSFGGDRVSPLSSARYADPLLFFLPSIQSCRSFIYPTICCVNSSSEQWWDSRFGEPGRDPETSSAFPQRRPPPPVSHLPGDRPAPSWAAGPATVESEGKGQQERFCALLTFIKTMTSYNNYSTACVSSILRGKFSPSCERGVHTAPAILYQIRRMMKRPITCFESSFLAIRWSSVSVFNLSALPPRANRMKRHQTTLFS